EECVRLLGGITALEGVLDPRPELILHPVTRDQHFDPTQAEIATLHRGARVARLQRPYGIECEIGQQPRLRNQNLRAFAGLLWHAETIDGACRPRDAMLLV